MVKKLWYFEIINLKRVDENLVHFEYFGEQFIPLGTVILKHLLSN